MDIQPILAIFLIYFVRYASGEAFSATANLIHLVETERQLIPTLESYIIQEEDRLNDIRRYIEEIRAKNSSHNEGLFYAGHPVNAYNLIKRWYRLAASTPNTATSTEISERFSTLSLPSEDDFNGASAALLRLQRTFALQTDDVAEGRILNEPAVKPLTEDDFIHIGTIALQNDDYGLAAEWFEKALASNGERIQSYLTVYKALTRTYKMMGNIEKAVEYAAKACELDKADADLDREHNQLFLQLERIRNSEENKASPWKRWIPSWKENYERLCRGEADSTSDPKHTKDLVCRYKPGKIPWVVYKEEILSWDPRIGMFYDVISDREAEMVKEKAYPLLIRAMVGDPNESVVTPNRISKVAWLWDTDPEIEMLSKRVEDVTGLETQYRNPLSSAEPFQVVNYGIGGQYEPHVDYYEDPAALNTPGNVPDFITGTGDRICTFLFYQTQQLQNVPDFILNTGDRLSTFLLYLTDVKHGGSTVFPRMNIRVPATKNGAAFWYNAKLSGEFDKRTEHAGCPVLLGQKWVTNKWIREYGQEARRPCALDQDAVDRS